MSLPFLFAGITAATFVWRLVGLSLNLARPSPFWSNFLKFVPIAIFTALMVSSLSRETELLSVKLIALALAGGFVWRTRQVGLSVIGGLLVLWVFVWLSAR